MKTGIELISEERKEQIEKHDYNLQYDSDFNNGDELCRAAVIIIDSEHNDGEDWCRLDWSKEMYLKIISKPRVKQLAIAGALIAAEIDRLNHKINGI